MTLHRLITNDCCVINARIAKELGLDNEKSKYPFLCDGKSLYGISKSDINLLSFEEIKQLEEYTPPEIEEV